MTYYLIAGLNMISFGVTFIIALLRFPFLDKGMKFFAISCITAFITEAIALYMAINLGNNMPVYAIYNIIEVFLLCMFFNYSLPSLERGKIGLWLGVISVLLGLANLFLLQSLKALNNNFIYYQGIMAIGLCMFSIVSEIKSSEDTNVRFSTRFYISVLLIIYWLASFLYWGLYEYLISMFGKDNILLNYMMVFICCLLNAGFCMLLTRAPKATNNV